MATRVKGGANASSVGKKLETYKAAKTMIKNAKG